jgi:hypothetical protein
VLHLIFLPGHGTGVICSSHFISIVLDVWPT